MPISANNVSFHKSLYTVGADHSLGGAIGDSIASQVAVQPAIITGVYIAQAFGNAVGGGTMTYNSVTQELSWKAPGSGITVVQPVTTSGSYTLFTVNGTLIVNVTVGTLPDTYKVETIAISNPVGSLFSQVTATHSLVGDIQYRCVYFKNSHPSLTASDIRLYLALPPALPQLMAIGVDPAGAGNGTSTGVAQTIASTTTAPTGVTFTAPVLAGSGIVLPNLAPNQSVAIWQRRTVPPMSYGALTIQSAALGVALVG